MPLCADPNQTTTFHLESDEGVPPDKRAAFETRFLTARQWQQVNDLLEKARAAKGAEALDLLVKAISVGVVGAKGMPGQAPSVAVPPVNFPDVLTNGELWEVVYGMLLAVQLSESDRKKSARRPTSDAAPSADSAAAVSA